jgi:hypothetical protein
VNELSDIERAEALLWESVRALYGRTTENRVQAAATVVESLAAYRAAVERATRLRMRHSSEATAVLVTA